MLFVREDGRLRSGSSEVGSKVDDTRTGGGMVVQGDEDELTVMEQGMFTFMPPADFPYLSQPGDSPSNPKIILPNGQEATLNELAIANALQKMKENPQLGLEAALDWFAETLGQALSQYRSGSADNNE